MRFLYLWIPKRIVCFMKKIITFSIFFCCTFLLYAQENAIGNYDDKGKTLAPAHAPSDSTLRLNNILPQMDKEMGSILYQNSYTTTDFNYRNPWGYSNQYIGVINPYLSYSITGRSDVWPGITAINSASFSLNYAQDSFLFNVGTGLWKYDNLGRSFTDATIYSNASYQVLPWLTVGAYGVYSFMAKQNVLDGSALPAPMVPYTGYGLYARAMFNSTFGVEGSVGREFNPIKGKWQPTYSFGPVIELKRKKR